MAVWKLEDRMKESLDVKAKIKSLGQDPQNFCLVPFTTIILEPDGQVGICRHKGHNFPIGHIQKNSISEIWNGPLARQWRRDFLDGRPKICQQETRHRHCQHCPENNKLLDYVQFEEIQTGPILKLTANFNGKCNLQCQMCDVWKLPNGLYDQLNFWEPAKRDIFPHLKEVDMLSGEPFIQKDTFRLIDEISAVNPDCQWIFTTNMHWQLSDSIQSSLDKIFIKNIIMSVDSLDEMTYAKIRHPGKLSFVLKNIENMVEYNKKRTHLGKSDIRLVWNFLVQKDNWQEVPAVIQYVESRGIVPLISFLYDPSDFSLLTLPEEKRLDIFIHYMNTLTQNQVVQTMKVLTPLLDSLPPLLKANALLEMNEKMKDYTL